MMEAEIGITTASQKPLTIAGHKQRLKRDKERFFPRTFRMSKALTSIFTLDF